MFLVGVCFDDCWLCGSNCCIIVNFVVVVFIVIIFVVVVV